MWSDSMQSEHGCSNRMFILFHAFSWSFHICVNMRIIYSIMAMLCIIIICDGDELQHQDLQCDVCKTFAKYAYDLIQRNASINTIEKFGSIFCKKHHIEQDDVVRMMCDTMLIDVMLHSTGRHQQTVIYHILHHIQCDGMAKAFVPVAVDVITRYGLQPSLLCYHLRLCHDKSADVNNGIEFDRTFSNNDDNKHAIHQTAEGSSYYVVSFTDFHIDPQYSPGSAVGCGRPLCCRADTNGTGSAGYWGSLTCDMPIWTAISMLKFINDELPMRDNVAFITYGGDSTAHDIWKNERQTVVNDTHIIYNLFNKYLSRPVYGTIGNHDTWPASQYCSSCPQYDYVKDEFASVMSRVLPSQSLDTIYKGGYYAVRVLPRLMLISMYTHTGDMTNLYNIAESFNIDSTNQSTWLRSVLNDCRRDGDKAMLLGHIPPGISSAMQPFSHWIDKIIREYADVIVTTITGHTHDDHQEIVYDSDIIGHNPVSVIHVVPGATTYMDDYGLNPGFRVFEFNRETHEMTKMFTYSLNVSDANLHGAASWRLEYEAKSEYSMQDLSPSSWDKLAKQLPHSDMLARKYFYNKYLQVPPSDYCDFKHDDVNGRCRHKLSCRMMCDTPLKYNLCLKMSIDS